MPDFEHSPGTQLPTPVRERPTTDCHGSASTQTLWRVNIRSTGYTSDLGLNPQVGRSRRRPRSRPDTRPGPRWPEALRGRYRSPGHGERAPRRSWSSPGNARSRASGGPMGSTLSCPDVWGRVKRTTTCCAWPGLDVHRRGDDPGGALGAQRVQGRIAVDPGDRGVPGEVDGQDPQVLAVHGPEARDRARR